jgi:hypothetical protein
MNTVLPACFRSSMTGPEPALVDGMDFFEAFIDGFVKSPSAALRFTFVVAAYHPSTPHSSGFARLASGAF